MLIKITDNEKDFYEQSAIRIAEVIRNNPKAKIGLSTGRTTKGVHRALLKMHETEHFDCSRLKIFGIDEVTNISRSCKASCYYILLHEVVEPLGVSAENFIMPDPMAKDFEKECEKFEEKISAEGGPEFIFLGLGENGHMGFNQPNTPFGQTTWVSWMDNSLDERLRRENNIPDDVKMGGLTLGIKNLMQCKQLVVGANGAGKAKAVEKMIKGPVTEAVPASILQLHPRCEVILDTAAASLI